MADYLFIYNLAFQIQVTVRPANTNQEDNALSSPEVQWQLIYNM